MSVSVGKSLGDIRGVDADVYQSLENVTSSNEIKVTFLLESVDRYGTEMVGWCCNLILGRDQL